MDLSVLLKRHKPEADIETAAGGAASTAKKFKGNVGEDADAAEDGLMAVEQALRQKDLQFAVNILLKMACQHAQLLRDMAASEWVSMILPTGALVVAAGREAGKMYAQCAQISTAKPHLGPPHLYIVRAAYKCLCEAEAVKTTAADSHVILSRLYEQFMSNKSVSMTVFGLLFRHFRLKKCYNDQYTRVQFSIADQVTLKNNLNEDITYSKLELEQATIHAMEAMGGKLKLGTAPQGHLENMAQKLLDRNKTGGRGKGKGRG